MLPALAVTDTGGVAGSSNTIWGVVAGQLLKEASPAAEKIKKLVAFGVV